MNLSDIVPLTRIETELGRPLRVEYLQTAELREILERNADDLFGIAASTWHRIVMADRFEVDPMQMRQYFESEDPKLAYGIEQVIGRPMLKEFGFLRATVQHSGKPFLVATSCAVHLYSDELHLYDIALSDPRHPLSRQARKSETQHHRGFGLLSEVMRNVFGAARERNCSIITLTAANRRLIEVFARHGFAVEQGQFAQQALRFGIGIPMVACVEIRA